MTPFELWSILKSGAHIDALRDNPPSGSPIPAEITIRMPGYCSEMGVELTATEQWRVYDNQKFYEWAVRSCIWTEEELAELEPLLVLELAGG